MTIAMIWILAQMEAPWWCFALTVAMFFIKALLMFGLYGERK